MNPQFFTKEPIPKITNTALQRAIQEVKNADSPLDALKTAYRIITKKYEGKRFRTYIYFWKALEEDPNKLWEKRGFLHCTQMNYLLRVLLVKSGCFTEKQIELKKSLVWFVSPHQYIQVRIGGEKIFLDPWNEAYGGGFGKYAIGFGFKSA